jgi:hypothetical protein
MFLLVNNTLYLNNTDHDLHLRGLVKSILPEHTGQILISLSFWDVSTNAHVHDVAVYHYGPMHMGVNPSEVLPFDMDMGYNVTQSSKDWRYITAQLAADELYYNLHRSRIGDCKSSESLAIKTI